MADEPAVLTPNDEDDARRNHAIECAAGLRELADWIDAHTDVIHSSDLTGVKFFVCRVDKDEFLEAARALGPNVEQKNDASYFHLIRRFGPAEVQLYIDPKYIGSPKTEMREVTEWQIDPEVRAVIERAA